MGFKLIKYFLPSSYVTLLVALKSNFVTSVVIILYFRNNIIM